ncbi:Protein of unknown function [Cotesia congregata]|uniref:Uncharacterized protein n=1 Tax=Cotesia congregata TaxID=51543 RepID=A0A8J2HFD5_COTCN|nr:Protein of unknown function [Cotesia congregata]
MYRLTPKYLRKCPNTAPVKSGTQIDPNGPEELVVAEEFDAGEELGVVLKGWSSKLKKSSISTVCNSG